MVQTTQLIRIYLCALAMLASPALAQQPVSGSLGQSHPSSLSQGQLYEYYVLSYEFTPGFYFTSPSGALSYTWRDAIIEPYFDGTATVYGTRTKFIAYESGTYTIDVYSWDRQQPGQPYSIILNFLGEAVNPPAKPPAPRRKPPVRDGVVQPPALSCGDNSGIPNYDDLPCVAR